MLREYAVYVRKSRVDVEAEAHGQGDTLRRHKERLFDLAKQLNLSISAVYEEVVSGETITSRPQMQKLLQNVEQGHFAGVLVMEVERLARGDTIDQGIVARTFQYSGTKIITPSKTYDPASEFDREYFEFGLFMSRREYQTINRRQQAGRAASVREGKWPSNKAPYGYAREKLKNQKGWTLSPDECAPVVADIFRWYTYGALAEDGAVQKLGAARIVRRLNGLHISSPGGKNWTNQAVISVLRNPVYAGWVRWGKRHQVKRMENGEVLTSRPRAKEDGTMLCPGLHPPLVTQETFDMAQQLLYRAGSHPGPRSLPLKNPLAGLVKCAQCGRSMVRRPYRDGTKDVLLCPYTSCQTVASDLAQVEQALLSALRSWLGGFEQVPPENPEFLNQEELATLNRSIAVLQRKLERLSAQEHRAYELVEQGIYTPRIFSDRMAELSQNRKAVQKQLKALQKSAETMENTREKPLQPHATVQYVLDAYNMAKTPKEKSDLLRSLLDHVEYHKSTGGRYRESDLCLVLYPRLPEQGLQTI